MLLFIIGIAFGIIAVPTFHKIAELICISFDYFIHKINQKIKEMVGPEETNSHVVGFVTDENYDCWEDDEEE